MPAAEPVRPGRRTDRRPRLASALAAPVVALGLLVSASACYTNTNAATQRSYQPADGVDADSGLLRVRNLQVVSSGTGGTLVGAIANDGTAPDTLTAITVGGRPAQLTLASRTLVPQQLLSFGTTDGPQAFVPGTYTPGGLVPVVLTFGRATAVDLQVPVLPRYDYTTSVPTSGAAVPTATPTTGLGATPGTPTAQPGASGSQRPTASPGATGGVPKGN
jgi:hypothetical protein